MTKDLALQRLLDCGIVAVIRASSDAQLLPIAHALLAGGVTAIEVTMTTPNALQGIEKLAATFGDQITLGVGTVLDPDTASAAIKAGAQFVFSPTLDTRVIETTKKLGKLSVPGAFTPTEIYTAWSAGADLVKIFPATSLGPTYIKDLLAPMPFLKLTPTGGVDLASAAAWIKAGAACLGAGSCLISKEALAKNDYAAITTTAKQFIEIIKTARQK